MALAIVATALFLDMVLYGLVVPVVPAYGHRLGATNAQIGVLFASYAFALLAATPPMGALSARIGRRGPLLFGLAGAAVATALFGYATSLPALIAARVLQGVAAAASWTSGLALVADETPKEMRGRAFGASSAASSFGTLLGPPLGGFLADRWGYRAPFLVVAAVTAFAFVVAAATLRQRPRASNEQAPPASRLLRDPQALTACAFVALGAAVLGVIEPVLPLDLSRRLGASPTAIGLYFVAATVAYGIASPAIGWASDRFGFSRSMQAGLVASALLLPVLALPTNAVQQVAAMAALGVALATMLTPTLPALAAHVDRIGGDYAFAYAAYNAAYAVGLAIGAALGGKLVDLTGVRTALATMACAILVFGAWPAVVARRSERA